MKLSEILQTVKILIQIADQVAGFIADSDIPPESQEVVEKEVDYAVQRLHDAKNLIPLPAVSGSNSVNQSKPEKLENN